MNMRPAFCAAVIVAALSSSLSAQWPLHQAASGPKTPDGKIDLNAPAPRTADGKPDLSGIWMARPGAELSPPTAGRRSRLSATWALE
jgi:hypothetical protein